MKSSSTQTNYTQSLVSPLCAVLVTRLTVTLSVGKFEDQALLAIVHPGGTRRHTIGTISEVGACHTLVCALRRRKGRGNKEWKRHGSRRNSMSNICAALSFRFCLIDYDVYRSSTADSPSLWLTLWMAGNTFTIKSCKFPWDPRNSVWIFI